MDYYRSSGVDRFFLIDNDSSDLTRDLLLAEEDTHLFHTIQSFGKARCGQDWIDSLLNRFGQGHWCICVNADEILTYPYRDRFSLKSLCRYLDSDGSTALTAMLLDMYGDRPIADLSYRPGQDPLEVCMYFDASQPEEEPSSRNPEVIYKRGGMRERVFGVRACLNKVPLFKYSKEVRLIEGFHFIENAKASDLTGVILHFKYLHDFRERVVEEAGREEHWDAGIEYKAYFEALSRDTSINPYHEGSVRYTAWQQLVDLGFMRNSPALSKYVREITSHSDHRGE
jgi:hypothetical protein